MSNKLDKLTNKLNDAFGEVNNNTSSIRGSVARPLFKFADIWNATNRLAMLVRAICAIEKVSLSDIEKSLLAKGLRHGRSKKEIDGDKGNLVKAITRQNVSFNKVIQLLETTLGYQVEIALHLTKDGETRSYKYTDTMTRARELHEQEHQKTS